MTSILQLSWRYSEQIFFKFEIALKDFGVWPAIYRRRTTGLPELLGPTVFFFKIQPFPFANAGILRRGPGPAACGHRLAIFLRLSHAFFILFRCLFRQLILRFQLRLEHGDLRLQGQALLSRPLPFRL